MIKSLACLVVPWALITYYVSHNTPPDDDDGAFWCGLIGTFIFWMICGLFVGGSKTSPTDGTY